jgi:hypothetical protein
MGDPYQTYTNPIPNYTIEKEKEKEIEKEIGIDKWIDKEYANNEAAKQWSIISADIL